MAARLKDQLGRHRHRSFAVFNRALSDEVWGAMVVSGLFFRSVFDGLEAARNHDIAPYLMPLPSGEEKVEALLDMVDGKRWCLLVDSEASFAELRAHLRRFVVDEWVSDLAEDEEAAGDDVEEESEPPQRIFDVATMLEQLPTWEPPRIVDFFGPIASFIMDGEEPGQYLELRPGGEEGLALVSLSAGEADA